MLQSAEVMKKAVRHLELFLERKEGYTKGKVVLATVYGDVHDIGKSLVNTILSNNGYTVFDLGRTGARQYDHREGDRGQRGCNRAVGIAGVDVQADAALRAGAGQAQPNDSRAYWRSGDQPTLWPARRSS